MEAEKKSSDRLPTPDPTPLTQEAIDRGTKSERDYVDGKFGILEQRLAGMDKATSLLSETVNRVPTDVQEAIAHLKELHSEKFETLTQRFVGNDVAVAAAFAAQKEAAYAQNQANREAIATNQQMTAEAIRNLGQLLVTNYATLSDKLDDLKGSRREGVGLSANVAAVVVGLVLTGIGTAIALAIAFAPK